MHFLANENFPLPSIQRNPKGNLYMYSFTRLAHR
jgi:hypothetical protein